MAKAGGMAKGGVVGTDGSIFFGALLSVLPGITSPDAKIFCAAWPVNADCGTNKGKVLGRLAALLNAGAEEMLFLGISTKMGAA